MIDKIAGKAKELFKDKKAIFGLTSVQQFFAIILGIALLAYVIIAIMGTLNDSSILPSATVVNTITNESSAFLNNSGYTILFNPTNTVGFANPVITSVVNQTSGAVIAASNYQISSAGLVRNATGTIFTTVGISYTYNTNSLQKTQVNNILSNTSSGITSFFGSVNPVYAILAIMVIILVLVVLVRVVAGGNVQGRAVNPQL